MCPHETLIDERLYLPEERTTTGSIVVSNGNMVANAAILPIFLAGATVTFAGQAAISCSTGAYTISGISVGTYSGTVSKVDYVTATINITIISTIVNQSTSIFSLAPITYTLTGTVRAGRIALEPSCPTPPYQLQARSLPSAELEHTLSSGTFRGPTQPP